jgi:hypothetical protein
MYYVLHYIIWNGNLEFLNCGVLITVPWRNFTIDTKFLVSKIVYSIHTRTALSLQVHVALALFPTLPDIYPPAFMTSYYVDEESMEECWLVLITKT